MLYSSASLQEIKGKVIRTLLLSPHASAYLGVRKTGVRKVLFLFSSMHILLSNLNYGGRIDREKLQHVLYANQQKPNDLLIVHIRKVKNTSYEINNIKNAYIFIVISFTILTRKSFSSVQFL